MLVQFMVSPVSLVHTRHSDYNSLICSTEERSWESNLKPMPRFWRYVCVKAEFNLNELLQINVLVPFVVLLFSVGNH